MHILAHPVEEIMRANSVSCLSQGSMSDRTYRKKLPVYGVLNSGDTNTYA